MLLDVTLRIDGVDKRFSPKPPAPPLPAGWYPARIMQWHERYKMSYCLWHHLNDESGRGLANGDPAVVRRIVRSTEVQAKFTPALERWLFGLLHETTFGRVPEKTLLNAYKNLLADDKAYTDYSGWFHNQSVVLNVNIGASLMRMGYALPNGATVMVVGANENRMVKGIKTSVTPILALDSLDPNTLKATYANSPYTIQCATNCVTEPQPFGKVDPFPIIDGYSTPIPILAEGATRVYIETGWIQKLNQDQLGIRQYPYYNTSYTNVRW